MEIRFSWPLQSNGLLLLLLLVDEQRRLVAGSHGIQHDAEEGAYGAGHRRMEARVLAEDAGEQGRAGARQAGDEVQLGHGR